MTNRDESLTQLPQAEDYRHTIDMLQAKVWLYKITTVICFIASALMAWLK